MMLTPLSFAEWDRAKAAHLLNRAGFGGPPEQVDALARGGLDAALAQLVDGPLTPPEALPPAWAQPRNLLDLRAKIQNAMAAAPAGDAAAQNMARQEIARAERRAQDDHMLDLGVWWLDRMREAADPLAEKMTLFWHGHFATSFQKVHDAYLMWRQNQTFREHARANFGVLVKAMTRDPAMIQWLDLEQSRPQHPNENFAREVMELFALGEGHYTEQDVKEGARAFTGYRIDPRDESFHFAIGQHDNQAKQFLGHTVYDGDQAIEAMLAQPACAPFIARKLWTFFAAENPPDPIVASLAQSLRDSEYEVAPVLREIFGSREFYAPSVMRTQIKSPVQWMVQASRTLEIGLPPRGPLMGALRQMGQVPFVPPSVKGWDGGKTWISTSTLLFRYNLAGAMLAGIQPGKPPAWVAGAPNLPPPEPLAASAKPDLQKLAPPEVRGNAGTLVGHLALRLFDGSLPAKDRQPFIDYLAAVGPAITDAHVTGVMHLMMSTPSYQLC